MLLHTDWLPKVIFELLWETSLLMSLNFAMAYLRFIFDILRQQRDRVSKPAAEQSVPHSDSALRKKDCAVSKVRCLDWGTNIVFLALGLLDGYWVKAAGEHC